MTTLSCRASTASVFAKPWTCPRGMNNTSPGPTRTWRPSSVSMKMRSLSSAVLRSIGSSSVPRGRMLFALPGGITWFIRLASFVPFWSPFVMLTRLSVGRVEPIELVVSIAILAATIVLTAVIAIRIYGAGVLLYGQRPGIRAYVAAARHG